MRNAYFKAYYHCLKEKRPLGTDCDCDAWLVKDAVARGLFSVHEGSIPSRGIEFDRMARGVATREGKHADFYNVLGRPKAP